MTAEPNKSAFPSVTACIDLMDFPEALSGITPFIDMQSEWKIIAMQHCGMPSSCFPYLVSALT